jgi:hypothetical protein
MARVWVGFFLKDITVINVIVVFIETLCGILERQLTINNGSIFKKD